MRPVWIAGLAALAIASGARRAEAYPVSVKSCGDTVTFTQAPRRPLVNSLNMIQTFIDLGLLDRVIGVSNTQGVERTLIAPPDVIAKVSRKVISDTGMSREVILGQDADFYYAGWQYGFSSATGVTPAELARAGVKTYVLAESCIRIGKRPPITMDTVYADTLAIGKIFGVEARADALVAEQRRRIKAVTDKVAKAARRPRVMYCGGCASAEAPLSIGAEGMPKLIAVLAGGQNIFDDIPDSYVRVSWEAMVARDPEWIIVSDDRRPAAETIRYLTSTPALGSVTAIRKRQFIVLTYAERSPSTRNVAAVERFARMMHPELWR